MVTKLKLRKSIFCTTEMGSNSGFASERLVRPMRLGTRKTQEHNHQLRLRRPESVHDHLQKTKRNWWNRRLLQ